MKKYAINDLKGELMNIILDWGSKQNLPIDILKMVVLDLGLTFAVQSHLLEIDAAKVLIKMEQESAKNRH